MKIALPLILVAVTIALMVVAFVGPTRAHGTVGIAAGSALGGLTPKAATPEQALNNLLIEVQRRNWDRAFSDLSKASGSDENSFIRDWTSSDGSLRSYSNLEGFDLRPLHITNDDAQMRVRLHWSTPVGPAEDVRDIHLIREGDIWKAVWPKFQAPNVPAEVIPVTYLRWDLVTGTADDQWGSKNVDGPRVRIISMNAVDSATGVVVMGEVVNEDTIPAFVNVNSTLIDGAGNAIDDESSFDKIAHILLPKQVSPYRIDFPNVELKNVKNVRKSRAGSGLRRSSDRSDESENRHRRPRQKCPPRRPFQRERTDGQYSPRDRELLRQQRQSRMGLGRIRRSRASPAIVGTLRRGDSATVARQGAKFSRRS